MAGCRDEQFRESLDSGIPDSLGDEPPIEHKGANFRFVHHGRLVPYKATGLAIKAVAKAHNPVELDVICQGTELPRLERLAARRAGLRLVRPDREVDRDLSRAGPQVATRPGRGSAMIAPGRRDCRIWR
jgi:hypothetical protein